MAFAQRYNALMAFGFNRPGSRFRWSAFRGRCRHRLLAGLLVLIVAGAYGTWAAWRLGKRGDDLRAFDQPLVRLASSLTSLPEPLKGARAQTGREHYLMSVIGHQRDTMLGLTLLVLRMIVIVTAAGIGLTLLTAGSIEWEIRSEPSAPGGSAGAP